MLGFSFLISSEFGHFRVPYTNSYLATYPFPPKPTVLGMIGAAVGWSQKEVISHQRDFLIGVRIESKKIRIIQEDARLLKFEGGGGITPAIIKTEILVRPKYRIFVIGKNYDLVHKLFETFEKRNFVYPLYMGKNEFLAEIEDVQLYESPKEIRSNETDSVYFFRGKLPKISYIETSLPRVFLQVPLYLKLTERNTRVLDETCSVLFSEHTLSFDEGVKTWKLGEDVVSLI